MSSVDSPSAKIAPRISLAILTYRRNYLLQRQLAALSPWHEQLAEVIVVDNAAEASTVEICRRFSWVRLIQPPRNLGAAGRNLAFEAARSDFIVTLDDDVLDFRPDGLSILLRLFADPTLACINFKVIEEGTGKLVNWVHHRPAERFANESFDTYEITEGAAAFRCAALKVAGGYPESFFLSHEGPDLAWRLMDRDWRVLYSPEITRILQLFGLSQILLRSLARAILTCRKLRNALGIDVKPYGRIVLPEFHRKWQSNIA